MHTKSDRLRWRPLPLFLGFAVLAACEPTSVSGTTDVARLRAGPEASTEFLNAIPAMVPYRDRESFAPTGGWESPTGPFIDCGPYGQLSASYEGRGVMSHLGRVASHIVFETCVVNAQGKAVLTGTATYTAANGDQLMGEFTQTFDMLTLQFATFRIDPIAMVGGTGRFAGVSGHATGAGTVSIMEGWGRWEINGMMTPPGIAKQGAP